MDQKRTEYLLQRYLENRLSESETVELLLLIGDEETNLSDDLIQRIDAIQSPDQKARPYNEGKWDVMLSEILSSDRPEDLNTEESPKRLSVSGWLAAASVILAFGLSFWFLLGNTNWFQRDKMAAHVSDVPAGGNKAVISFHSGKTVVLSDTAGGLVYRGDGIEVTRSAKGQLSIVSIPGTASAAEIKPVTIRTPRGGTYQVVLPDGSKVWLNAASSLRFPSSFATDQRLVQVSGEAYFDVTKEFLKNGRRKPFLVKTDAYLVSVLGTQFNINAYPEEQAVKTTLVEGSVAITRNGESQMLKPGQEALAQNGHPVHISDANIEDVIAWKNESFQFTDLDILSVMRQLSRWYDVEVQYSGEIANEHYTGYISRNKPVSKVLEMLSEIGDLNFTIKDNAITVKNKPSK